MSTDRLQLSDRFVQHVAGEIAARSWAPGDAIPSEDGLASSYGLSKPTVRQGLKKLASLGLIAIRHGKRSVVLDESHWDVLDRTVQEALSGAGRGAELTRHLWELRRLLESAAAAWAAERASDVLVEELVALTGELQAIATGSLDVQRFLEVDGLFHDLVSRAAGNPALRCVVGPTHRFLSGQLWSPGSQSRPEDLAALAEQHALIAAAISARDPDLARRRMADHVTFAERLETASSASRRDRGW